MGLTILATSIMVGVLFLLGMVAWTSVWLKNQRKRYTTLTYKRLAGNIKDSELRWWHSADNHRYTSGVVVITYHIDRLIKHLIKIKNTVKSAVGYEANYLFRKAWRVSKDNHAKNKYSHAIPNLDGRYAKEVANKKQRDKRWELLDTRKLREDAVCFDRGYMGECESEQLGVECNIPFTGSQKTETELQAEQILANKEVKQEDMTAEMHANIHDALQESKTLIRGLDKDIKPIPPYESHFDGVKTEEIKGYHTFNGMGGYRDIEEEKRAKEAKQKYLDSMDHLDEKQREWKIEQELKKNESKDL